ncbi:DNA double-strand break repair nuclease NurA [soil metagenome]
MLDFMKISQLVAQIGADAVVEKQDYERILASALSAFSGAAKDSEKFEQKLSENAPWVLWPTARPLEPVGHRETVAALNTANQPWTVVAVDGSQIMPSHHEVHNCYLLNAGVARISYGLPLAPLLYTEPRLHARPDDLYPLVDRRRVHIDELYVSLERGLFELELLTETACQAAAQGPTLAMYDGSLIPWSVEKMSSSYQETFFARQDEMIARLRLAKVPIVGYLSHSRSSDLVNCLRVSICPYEISHCRDHCGSLNEEEFPCSKVWPLGDRGLFDRILSINQRSSVFASGASVTKLMPASDRSCFVYWRGASEVARIEMPRWVFDDKELFQFALQGVRTQVEKGQGYPVALAEAHHLAVIKGPERERFFELVTNQMISLGVGNIRVSPKESQKRSGFV